MKYILIFILSLFVISCKENVTYHDNTGKTKYIDRKLDKYLIIYKNGTKDTIKCERGESIYMSNDGILEFEGGKILGITAFMKIRE